MKNSTRKDAARIVQHAEKITKSHYGGNVAPRACCDRVAVNRGVYGLNWAVYTDGKGWYHIDGCRNIPDVFRGAREIVHGSKEWQNPATA